MFSGALGQLQCGILHLLPPGLVLEIKELWFGQAFRSDNISWKQTITGVRGAFGVLTEVEDLTIVGCDTTMFSVLGATTVAGGEQNLAPGTT